MFLIKWIGLDKIIRGLRRPKTKVIAMALGVITRSVHTSVIESAPKGETGRLGKSIVSTQTGDLRYEIRETSPYGKFVRLGTRPHAIYPVEKLALYWPGIRVGHPIPFAMHPGIKPNPYHERGVQNYMGKRGLAEKALGEAVAIDVVR